MEGLAPPLKSPLLTNLDRKDLTLFWANDLSVLTDVRAENNLIVVFASHGITSSYNHGLGNFAKLTCCAVRSNLPSAICDCNLPREQGRHFKSRSFASSRFGPPPEPGILPKKAFSTLLIHLLCMLCSKSTTYCVFM